MNIDGYSLIVLTLLYRRRKGLTLEEIDTAIRRLKSDWMNPHQTRTALEDLIQMNLVTSGFTRISDGRGNLVTEPIYETTEDGFSVAGEYYRQFCLARPTI